MKPTPFALVMLGGILFWVAAISLWWTRGLYVGTAILLGILMAIGGCIVIAAGLVDPKEPRWYKCPWCHCFFSSDGAIVPELRFTDIDPDELISHGICPACDRKIEESARTK